MVMRRLPDNPAPRTAVAAGSGRRWSHREVQVQDRPGKQRACALGDLVTQHHRVCLNVSVLFTRTSLAGSPSSAITDSTRRTCAASASAKSSTETSVRSRWRVSFAIGVRANPMAKGLLGLEQGHCLLGLRCSHAHAIIQPAGSGYPMRCVTEVVGATTTTARRPLAVPAPRQLLSVGPPRPAPRVRDARAPSASHRSLQRHVGASRSALH